MNAAILRTHDPEGDPFRYPVRMGKASAIAPHAETVDDLRRADGHALLLDFDRDDLRRVTGALIRAVETFDLPPVAVYASGSKGGYHAWSLCNRPAAEIAAIAAFCRSDRDHQSALRMHGFGVLRIGPKFRWDGTIETAAPRFVRMIPSGNPAECEPGDLRSVEFSARLAR